MTDTNIIISMVQAWPLIFLKNNKVKHLGIARGGNQGTLYNNVDFCRHLNHASANPSKK